MCESFRGVKLGRERVVNLEARAGFSRALVAPFAQKFALFLSVSMEPAGEGKGAGKEAWDEGPTDAEVDAAIYPQGHAQPHVTEQKHKQRRPRQQYSASRTAWCQQKVGRGAYRQQDNCRLLGREREQEANKGCEVSPRRVQPQRREPERRREQIRAADAICDGLRIERMRAK